MLKRRHFPKNFKDITVPRVGTMRKTIFFDESGEEKMPFKTIPHNSPDRFFIYTGVCFNNYDIKDLQQYYFNLKRKFLGTVREIHSTEFFRQETKNKLSYIKALAAFIDTLPFFYTTVIVDKKKLFDESKIITIKEPMTTTFQKALSIFKSEGLKEEEFFDSPLRDILKVTSQYSFKNINNYQPLKLAYLTILEQYFINIPPKYFKPVYEDYKDTSIFAELKFETSPNRARLLSFTEQLRSQDSKLGNVLKNNIYDISFPFKKSKYMGLEIADIISYGYHLEKYKRLTMTPLYKPIRKAILRRARVFEEELGLNTVLEI